MVRVIAMDAKAMFNLFLAFSRQLSDSSGSGNIASAGHFEKFMKSNQEGAVVDDPPEGPVSLDELDGNMRWTINLLILCKRMILLEAILAVTKEVYMLDHT